MSRRLFWLTILLVGRYTYKPNTIRVIFYFQRACSDAISLAYKCIIYYYYDTIMTQLSSTYGSALCQNRMEIRKRQISPVGIHCSVNPKSNLTSQQFENVFVGTYSHVYIRRYTIYDISIIICPQQLKTLMMSRSKIVSFHSWFFFV